jgi:hypothetical protein
MKGKKNGRRKSCEARKEKMQGLMKETKNLLRVLSSGI